MFNRETHKSRGFGFIVFELERSAELVCLEKEHIIDGKVVSGIVIALEDSSAALFNVIIDV
jgi:RNA recognition motif-containing protein